MMLARGDGPRRQSMEVPYFVPLPDPPVFDGSSSWQSFIVPFDSMASWSCWDDDEKLLRFMNCLRGNAAEYAFTLITPETASCYTTLRASLELRYKERRPPTAYLIQLEAIEHHQDGDINRYIASLRKLVSNGYPTADGVTRESIVLRHFLRGLSDRECAVSIGMRFPKNVEEARTAYELYRGLSDDGVKSSDVHSVVSYAGDYISHDDLSKVSEKLDKVLSNVSANRHAVQSFEKDDEVSEKLSAASSTGWALAHKQTDVCIDEQLVKDKQPVSNDNRDTTVSAEEGRILYPWFYEEYMQETNTMSTVKMNAIVQCCASEPDHTLDTCTGDTDTSDVLDVSEFPVSVNKDHDSRGYSADVVVDEQGNVSESTGYLQSEMLISITCSYIRGIGDSLMWIFAAFVRFIVAIVKADFMEHYHRGAAMYWNLLSIWKDHMHSGDVELENRSLMMDDVDSIRTIAVVSEVDRSMTREAVIRSTIQQNQGDERSPGAGDFDVMYMMYGVAAHMYILVVSLLVKCEVISQWMCACRDPLPLKIYKIVWCSCQAVSLFCHQVCAKLSRGISPWLWKEILLQVYVDVAQEKPPSFDTWTVSGHTIRNTSSRFETTGCVNFLDGNAEIADRSKKHERVPDVCEVIKWWDISQRSVCHLCLS